jgi:hypothetical protein
LKKFPPGHIFFLHFIPVGNILYLTNGGNRPDRGDSS